MEVIKCITKVAMETVGEARNLSPGQTIEQSWIQRSNLLDPTLLDRLAAHVG